MIAVKVVPHSIKHTGTVDCESTTPLEIPSGELTSGQPFPVTYTYSIKFVVSLRDHTIEGYFNNNW